MAQLVASMSGEVLSGVVRVVGSNLVRGEIFTASSGSVDLPNTGRQKFSETSSHFQCNGRGINS